MPKDGNFDRSVFVNCPLDEDYDRILTGDSILFSAIRRRRAHKSAGVGNSEVSLSTPVVKIPMQVSRTLTITVPICGR